MTLFLLFLLNYLLLPSVPPPCATPISAFSEWQLRRFSLGFQCLAFWFPVLGAALQPRGPQEWARRASLGPCPPDEGTEHPEKLPGAGQCAEA